MRAITLSGFDTPPTLTDDTPAPTPGDGELLVRVHASSVNPVDNAIAAGMLNGIADHDFPVTLGRDYAGVIEQIGSGVTRYDPGDEVYGFLLHANPSVRDGAWTELIVVPEDDLVARKPSGVDFATAGAAPLAGITAMLSVDALELTEGDALLVVGASGGVGSFAVQLAAQAGATVIAPALTEDEEYLRTLGVSRRIDRGELPGGVDALLDLVSYSPGAFDAALSHGARVASPLGAAGEGPGRSNVMGVPSPENLERLGRLLEDGTLKVPLQARYRLDQAAEALQALAMTHTQGKLGIDVA